jgi:hypothetical protein
VRHFVGLSVSIDGERPVCIACAERFAKECGYEHLFWVANCPQRCIATGVCPSCCKRMDSDEAQEAAGRVAALLKPNTALRINEENTQ